MKPVPGLCDRCGQRYDLSKLRFEYILGRNTGLRTCPECYDESHPQLDTRHIRTDDKQRVEHSRSDSAELQASRALYSFDPVGGGLATQADVKLGTVTVRGS